MSSSERGSWGSRAGFILAAAGSAVGLGNIWGFPTKVGQGGGAVFVLVYLFCVFFICAPILIAEMALGRGSERDPMGAYRFYRPNSSWWIVGGMGILCGVGILSFYSVIAGWTLAYIFYSLTGAVSGTEQQIADFFNRFTANGPLNVFLTFLFIAGTAAAILGGVRSGIERATKIMMPALFVILVLLAGYALTLPGASQGLAYYLRPDFSLALKPAVFNAALGQAFFSLSLGMGCLITYGSYLAKNESIGSSALWVVSLDTSVALLAGFVVFPTGFSIPGFDPSASGPGLIFSVLPRLFTTMPGGTLFGVAFFILLALAAFTSTISLLEVPVSHFIDEHRWTRKKAVGVLALVSFVLSIPSALGNGYVPALTNFVSPFWGGNFLGLMARIWNDFALPIGGFLTALFVGYVWRTENALKELTREGTWFPYPALWSFLIRFVSPVAIAFIIVATLWPLFFPA